MLTADAVEEFLYCTGAQMLAAMHAARIYNVFATCPAAPRKHRHNFVWAARSANILLCMLHAVPPWPRPRDGQPIAVPWQSQSSRHAHP